MTALTAGWLTVSPSSTTARTSALVAATQSSEVAAISSAVGRVAPTIGGAPAASAMPWVLKKRSPAESSGHFGIAAGLGLLPPLHTCVARAGLGFAPNRAKLRRSSKSARDWPAPCRRCPFFRLALPTESDRTAPASAPQEPGGDGSDSGLRQGDGGVLQDGRRGSGHGRGVREEDDAGRGGAGQQPWAPGPPPGIAAEPPCQRELRKDEAGVEQAADRVIAMPRRARLAGHAEQHMVVAQQAVLHVFDWLALLVRCDRAMDADPDPAPSGRRSPAPGQGPSVVLG